ncbi:cardiomyopathy-associated protein 5 [Gouania willdenowi]|uniref:cardiomyopathy-associated protein 5 n=1 Tax=Gouania willdenowi TaxID=441366 RepID=UPI0010569186|nr:cardiomyopathy-associated protein 5-like [Gouania willdenowi]
MEAFPQQEVDVEMTALEPEDVTGPNPNAGDEVESLRNSLRDAVHDVNVRPKMQCLMMDSSFSMVTVQGEDSGIAWETTPSGCSTPWPSESPAVADLSQSASPTPATHPAGKIIFVMDEEVISRRKKPKEKQQQEVLELSSSDGPGRPELVEFSQPNIKEGEEEEDRAEPNDPLEEKEQRLFTLVSEGSEILNIIVPPKLVTVDEEESRVMVDNLSYLEEKQVLKVNTESQDETLTPTTCGAIPPPAAADGMDPPGAPVAKPPVGAGATGHVDYFEAFSLMDAEAPGGPAAAGVCEEQVKPEVEERRDTEKPPQSEETATTTMADAEKSDSISLLEFTDEVFYGNMDSGLIKILHSRVGGAENTPIKVPSKISGSNLFGSQEDILTPIFLPEGPPKIIDPILLEEPKAMAFLYTDLYEEALGSRAKDEDAASVTSEKSFHSRQSDREARGYLEKYVLIDETPVVEVDQWTTEEPPADAPRTLTQDLYEFGDFLTTPGNIEVESPEEEEITDFFRSSGNSSPCDIEPFPRSAEDDDVPVMKSDTKEVKRVCIKVSETPIDSFSVSACHISSGDDSSLFLDYEDVSVPTDEDLWRDDSEINVPVPPPRRKVASSPKSRLDLTPLIPVDAIAQDEGGASGKEQREEEKETASPAETADEGDGCGEEVRRDSLDGLAAENWLDDPLVGESEENTIREEEHEMQTEAQDAPVEPVEPVEPVDPGEPVPPVQLVQPEKHKQIPAEEAKPKAQCVIL